MTESYKETEGEPPVIRRAKALEKILKEMTIGIEDGELIVGRTTSKATRWCSAPRSCTGNGIWKKSTAYRQENGTGSHL